MTHAMTPEQPSERAALESQDSSAPAGNSYEAPIDPIAEFDAIKESVRGALLRISRLAAVLRRQQRTAKLVKSTLLSLKQLGAVG